MSTPAFGRLIRADNGLCGAAGAFTRNGVSPSMLLMD